MNAQEAIEIMERDLSELKSIKYRKEVLKDTDGINYKKLSNAVEALSITLESAKLLHGKIVPSVKKDAEDIGFPEATSFYGVPLEKLGITKGDDQ